MAYYLLTVLEQDGGVEVQRLVKDLFRSRVSKPVGSESSIAVAAAVVLVMRWPGVGGGVVAIAQDTASSCCECIKRGAVCMTTKAEALL